MSSVYRKAAAVQWLSAPAPAPRCIVGMALLAATTFSWRGGGAELGTALH